jgi:predicted peptidase
MYLDHRMKTIKLPYLLPYIVVSIFFSSCEQENEIVPKKPVTDTITAVAKNIAEDVYSTQAEQPVKDSLLNVKDSAITDIATYQYGRFKEMPYRILFPKNYNPSKKYPLLLFLHGISERGTNNESQLIWGAPLFKSDTVRSNHQAIVIFPQCPVSNYWFDKSITELLKGLIDASVEKYGVDPHQINIGGLSMGAYGTYAMVSRYPDTFAAAIAISGDGDATKATAMSKPKWRIFAGGKDYVVSSEKSEKMANALEKAGASVSFTVYQNADHAGSWINAFSEPDFCSWLFGKAAPL